VAGRVLAAAGGPFTQSSMSQADAIDECSAGAEPSQVLSIAKTNFIGC
jgi:hypothetical protein